MPRAYDNSKRAIAAAQTAERIVGSTEALLLERPLVDITLADVAERAGVTVQTVIRHLGSREGCIEAVANRVRERIDTQRGHTKPGDVDAALADLLGHYEAEGLLILRLLAQEDASAFAHDSVVEGRSYHRRWIVHSFGPLLAEVDEGSIDALVAATDLYVWKLLRLDLGRSVSATRATITRLVRAILEGS